jgi:hypothetical protein
MASAIRNRSRRQRKLERYSKFLIPIPLGFVTPMIIGALQENAADPDPTMILGLPFLAALLLLPAAFIQLIIGLPTIAALRGKSLPAHILTGLALAILMIVSQGFGDIFSEIAGSINASPPDKFSDSRHGDTLNSLEPSRRFSGKEHLINEGATIEDIFAQIMKFGLPMMFAYFLVWNIFTSLPNQMHEELTEERPNRNQRPIRNLRGEELATTRKTVTRRRKTRVRRSL